MKFLHTADWHLGARFHDQRRADDEQDALDQLVALTAAHAIDVVLIAGDVFDNANPGAEEQERYYRCLARLRGEAGVATVVVIAGNHDSALRLEGPRALLEDLNIHVVGRLRRDDDPASCVVPLRDRSHATRALAVAVPFLRDGDLRLAATAEAPAEAAQRHAEALARRFAEARAAAHARDPKLPQIVLGHLVATGAALGGFERPVQVGNLASVQAADLAGDAAYLALGHLHRPQAVGGHESWRYSGSLLPTGFDEAASVRSVVLFELDGSGPTRIEIVPLRPFRAYCRLRGPAQDLRTQILELPVKAAEQATPFCEATVELAGPEPGLAQDLIELARQRGWALVSVKRERSSLPTEGPGSLIQLHELEPEEVFVKKHQSDFGTEPDDELLLAFRQLLEALGSETLAGSG